MTCACVHDMMFVKKKKSSSNQFKPENFAVLNTHFRGTTFMIL